MLLLKPVNVRNSWQNTIMLDFVDETILILDVVGKAKLMMNVDKRKIKLGG